MGATPGDQEQWKFPKVKLTELEKKDLLATVTMMATRVMFKNHLYTFGGRTFRQKKGGPIGLRGTCAIARLVMQIWDAKWLVRMRHLGVMK